MSHSLLRTEWRLLTRDRALATLLTILVAASAYGIYNGASMVRFQADTSAALQQDARTRMDEAIAMHAQMQQPAAGGEQPGYMRRAQPLSSMMGTQYAILPPAPLGILGTGQTDLTGFYAGVSARQQNAAPTDEIDNPVHLMAGRFDLTFVLLLLYPLLIMGLLFNLLSGEREQGTLRLIAAQPVRMTKVMWSKLAVRCGVVAAVPAVIAAGAVLLAEAEVARALLWLAIALCYGAFWVAVSLLVNAYGRTSAGNAAVLLAVWLLVIVGVPAAQQMLVSVNHPPPSQITLVAAMRAAQDEANKRGDDLVKELYFEHPELAPVQGEHAARQFYNRRMAIDLHVQKAVQPVLDAFDRDFVERQALAYRYRLLSPALTTQAALEDVTGTGMDRQRDFREQLRAFQDEWRTFAQREQLVSLQTQDGQADVPRFGFQEEPLAEVAARATPGLLVMLMLAAAMAGLASRRLSRVSRLL
jgi:ABC-2 type transport system permease protein